MYAELQTFLDFQPLKPTHFKTLATGIKSTDSSISCGQKQCEHKKPHSAEDCWVLHPEKRSNGLNKKSTNPTPGQNDSTSSKKTPKGLRTAGQGKNRDGKKGERAHKQLQRIKSYLTKNNLFNGEDVAAIAKGEDPGKNEVEDETPAKKKSRRVSVNALRIVIKNSQIF
jgi:hypothetical protein